MLRPFVHLGRAHMLLGEWCNPNCIWVLAAEVFIGGPLIIGALVWFLRRIIH